MVLDNYSESELKRKKKPTIQTVGEDILTVLPSLLFQIDTQLL